MYEYLAPIKLLFDLLKDGYTTIKKYVPSRKKTILGKELIKILLQLQLILSEAENIMYLIKDSKAIISEKGSNYYVENLRDKFRLQAHNISFFKSLFIQEQIRGLLSILIPEKKDKILMLMERKGSALFFVVDYLLTVQIKMEGEEAFVNNNIYFRDLEDIRKWVRNSEKIKLLEEVDDHEIIINQIKEKTEELRKFLLETFSLEEILSYTPTNI